MAAMKFAVAINMERFDPARRMDDVMREVLHLVQMADAGGFETAWTAEHHTIECTISPNPFTTLIWLASTRSGSGSAPRRWSRPTGHPIRLAGEAALCDHLTGGRLEFGIARGAYQYEFDRMAGGMPQQEGVAYMKEIVPAVQSSGPATTRMTATTGSSRSRPRCRSRCSSRIRRSGSRRAIPALSTGRSAIGANILSTPLSAPPAEIAVLGEKFRKAVADHPERPRPRLHDAAPHLRLRRAGDWEEPVRHSSRLRPLLREPDAEHRHGDQRLPRGGAVRDRRQPRATTIRRPSATT